jgi:hypothetical protein
MSTPVRILGIVVVLAGLGWLVWTPVRSTYVEPRADLERERVERTSKVNRYRTGTDDHLRVTNAVQAFVDRTLGGDLETVDHELRTRLNRLGEEIGLRKLSVGTGRVRQMESPARSLPAFRADRALREELDFVEVEASISGEGALEAVMQLVHRIEAEPWMKRVDQVRMQPRDNGERFVVTIRLVTIYLPDRTSTRPLKPTSDPADFDRYRHLAGRNPFRVAPKAAAAPPSQPLSTPRAVDKYRKWVLTGVVSGPDGVEVWLLHADSGRSRSLVVGQQIEEVRLVAAQGDTAEFQHGDDRFTVAIGRPLAK